MGAAVHYLQQTGLETIHKHELNLMQRFYDAVSTMEDVTVYGDFSGLRAPVVTLNIADCDSGEVADYLAAEYDIAVRSGATAPPGCMKPWAPKTRARFVSPSVGSIPSKKSMPPSKP